MWFTVIISNVFLYFLTNFYFSIDPMKCSITFWQCFVLQYNVSTIREVKYLSHSPLHPQSKGFYKFYVQSNNFITFMVDILLFFYPLPPHTQLFLLHHGWFFSTYLKFLLKTNKVPISTYVITEKNFNTE